MDNDRRISLLDGEPQVDAILVRALVCPFKEGLTGNTGDRGQNLTDRASQRSPGHARVTVRSFATRGLRGFESAGLDGIPGYDFPCTAGRPTRGGVLSACC
jgi:hypothetical protein